MKAKSSPSGGDASVKITQRIADLGAWRGEMLARVRELIHAANPDIVEPCRGGGQLGGTCGTSGEEKAPAIEA